MADCRQQGYEAEGPQRRVGDCPEAYARQGGKKCVGKDVYRYHNKLSLTNNNVTDSPSAMQTISRNA